MQKLTSLFLLLHLCCPGLYSQELNTLDLLQTEVSEKEYVTNAFKSSRVINGHSIEFIGKNVLDVRILHRMGTIKEGIGNFFGLDQASMRLGLDYGLGRNLMVGIGRTTTKQDVDGFVKWRVARQSLPGIPFSVVLTGGVSVFTFKNPDPQVKMTFATRSGYYSQAIIGRKFNNSFSLQLAPTYIHRDEPGLVNNIYSLGIGSRMKLTKRTAFVVDYFPILNRQRDPGAKNALSLGFDIETGGHVFQLHFSNATGMNERAFIANTTESWSKGEIRFGFNLSRVFTITNKDISTPH
jgi:hypothetical protein